ncbi:MAG: type II toxin-antitoxin system Phd/YefM family antitoxin [Kiritimatiellae bacterium]|nr:type II toxin-antitoxin system Phd/YefM family antitoxin [Kiritimatiellia bacterium]
MKVYTYSQARQNLSRVLNESKAEEVLIRRRRGEVFAVVPRQRTSSPFDVPGVNTRADTSAILSAVRESRSKTSQRHSRRRG